MRRLPSLFGAVLLLTACSSDGADDPATSASGAGGAGSATSVTNATSGSTSATDATTSTGSGPGRLLGLGSAVVVAGASEGLSVPRDLAFAPDHPEQLWIVNQATNGVVIVTQPGEGGQTVETRIDYHAGHFMAQPSALAFGIQNRFATASESRDDYNCGPQAEDDFMGPTYWSADLDVFAVVGQSPCQQGIPEGSHLDMLHASPLAMGIEHEADGVYWVADGLNGHLVRYDFAEPHDPGGGDHSDGKIRRYPETTFTRLANVPSHLSLDPDSNFLYLADTGVGRIMRLDLQSGAVSGPATTPPNWDGLSEYVKVEGVTWQKVVEGLSEPSGLVVTGGYLYVTEHGSGDIVAFDLEGKEAKRLATGSPGLMGLALGPNGVLWCVNGVTSELLRIEP